MKAAVVYRGEHLKDVVVTFANMFPDVHRELYRVNVMGTVVAIELSIHRTFSVPDENPCRRDPANRSKGQLSVRGLLLYEERQDRAIRLLQQLKRQCERNRPANANPLTRLFPMPGRIHVTHRAFARKTEIFLAWTILGARHATFPFYGALF